MARYLICSDIHGNTDNFRIAVEEAGDIDGVFVAGDLQCGEADLINELEDVLGESVRYRTDFLFYAVAGNCDYGSSLMPDATFGIAGDHTVFMAHGHRYGVPSLYEIENAAEDKGADIVIFGHTHNPLYEERDGFTFINPGALKGGYATARFAIMEVEDSGEISVEHFSF